MHPIPKIGKLCPIFRPYHPPKTLFLDKDKAKNRPSQVSKTQSWTRISQFWGLKNPMAWTNLWWSFRGPEEALEQLSMMDAAETANTAAASSGQASYCLECYLPLHPDLKPEQLYIFLHALLYTTSLGTFEMELPDWAEEGWSWDRELG
jgi:hypothetical protein